MASTAQGHAFTGASWDPLVSAYLEAALGVDKFQQVKAAIAVPPLSTCLRVNTLRTSVQDVLQHLQEVLPQHSSSVAAHPDVPAVLLKGAGPNQIDPKAAGVTKEVIVSRKAGEAVLRGAQVFVPGVLACSAGLSIGDLVTVTVALDRPGSSSSGITRGSVIPAKDAASQNSSSNANGNPAITATAQQADTAAVNGTSMADDGIQHLNTAAQQPAAALHPAAVQTDGSSQAAANGSQQHHSGSDKASPRHTSSATPPAAALVPGGRLCVGIGRAAMSRSEMFRVSHGVAVEMVQRVFDVPSSPLDNQLKGCAMLQNLPSIVAAQALNPRPGSRVLDMCAAPGGKTTILAQIMQGRGEVVALDRSHAKVDDIKALAAEMGCSEMVQAYKADSTASVRKLEKQLQELEQQKQQQQQQDQQPEQYYWMDEDWQKQQDAQNSSRKLLLLLQEAENSGKQQPQQRPQRQQELQQQPGVVMPIDTSGLSAKAVARMQRRLAAMAARGQAAGPAIQAEYRYYGFGPTKCPGFPPESFDHILLDAPCTALGLRPRLLQQHTMSVLLETAAYQRALMYAAVQLLKPGGTLVFSTCTISPAENEVNVRHLLDTYPCLKLIPAEPRIGGPGLTGPADAGALKSAVTAAIAQAVAEAKKHKPSVKTNYGHEPGPSAASPICKWTNVDTWCSEQWLTPDETAMVQRFDPAGPADTIGFFIAKFEKVCSC